MKHHVKKTITSTLLAISLFSLLFPAPVFSITFKKEEDLSRKFMEMVEKHYKFIDDPYIHDYVNKVGKRLVASLPQQPFSYSFYVIKENSFNAFAGPAGHIFINSGLLQAMESEEELAGILGHEIAHVSCRHISGNIDRSKKLQILSLAGLAAGILLGIGGAFDLSQAVTAGTLAGNQSIALAYSREDEMQADQLGLEYLLNAGYEGTGLIDSLKKIRSIDWIEGEIPAYLTTHPATSVRIMAINAWLDQHASKQDIKPVPPDLHGFKLMHTRLAAIYGETDVELTIYKNAVKDDPADAMTQYGYGLVLTEKGNYREAAVHLKMALERNPFAIPFLEDLGRAYYLSGDFQKAYNIYENVEAISSPTIETRYFIGACKMKTGHLQEAIHTLESLLQKDPEYSNALYTLGEIYNKQGLEGESHYYLGRYHKQKMEFKTAKFHLEKALKMLKSNERKEEVLALLNELKHNGKGNPEKPDEPSKSTVGFFNLYK